MLRNKIYSKRHIRIISLPSRITFEEKDYTYIFLTKSIKKETDSIRINLNGEEYELNHRLKGEWSTADGTVNNKPGLLVAIANY
ncbi:hypothetical protein [Pedobacter heparinus]|uniref:hypothetical protein n=1 Tax=Pedobacter heparinus TaxID=984 RepID=UPI00292F604D|nr:hypothetical protein [Pedobacter heparinus]